MAEADWLTYQLQMRKGAAAVLDDIWHRYGHPLYSPLSFLRHNNFTGHSTRPFITLLPGFSLGSFTHLRKSSGHEMGFDDSYSNQSNLEVLFAER